MGTLEPGELGPLISRFREQEYSIAACHISNADLRDIAKRARREREFGERGAHGVKIGNLLLSFTQTPRMTSALEPSRKPSASKKAPAF